MRCVEQEASFDENGAQHDPTPPRQPIRLFHGPGMLTIPLVAKRNEGTRVHEDHRERRSLPAMC
jgi:hypothetical protein